MNSLSDQPLVTVYIPTYNRLELLQRAVKSVQNQTYQNLEIIIVDDCSTDATQDYLAQLANEEPRVRYFLKEKNSGACISRNIAIENAAGEFITGLDDDDYFLNNRIEDFINVWKIKSSTTKVLYSLYLKKTKQGMINPNRGLRKKLIKKNVRAKDLLYYFYIGNQIFTETNLLQKNLFDEEFKAWQDFECYYRLLKKNECTAELVLKENYIVDISHPHERISTKKISNILDAFHSFGLKHDINGFNLILLKCHLYHYGGIEIKKKDIFLRFIFKPSFVDLKRLVK